MEEKLRNNLILEAAVWGMYAAVLIYISVSDIRERRIPDNGCVLIFMLGVVEMFCKTGMPCKERLLGACCISIPMLLFSSLARTFGGGDIKLMAAGGWFLGSGKVLDAFVIGVLLAGIYCLGALLSHKKTMRDAFALGPFLCMGMALVYCL